MGLPALLPDERHSPRPDGRRHRHVHIHLTPAAFAVGEEIPAISDPRRAMVHWSIDAERSMRDLVARLQRNPITLSVRYVPATDDVEILGRVSGVTDPVPLALVGYGLTEDECREALADLARGSR